MPAAVAYILAFVTVEVAEADYNDLYGGEAHLPAYALRLREMFPEFEHSAALVIRRNPSVPDRF